MKGRRFLRGVCFAALAFTCAFVLTTCGGGKAPPAQVPFLRVGGANQPRQTTLAETIAELEALSVPEGVDAKLFSQLKEALREALVHNVGAIHELPLRNLKPQTSNLAPAKLVSTPPEGPKNKVEDLVATKEGNVYVLTWHYRNCGDYNQDGIVDIKDITPLAVHFNETADETNEWIDGNADTVINIQDITPLAIGFFNTVDHYEVEASHLDFGPWNFVASAPLLEVTGERMRLTYDLGVTPAYTFWRVVPVDADGERGEPSNVASLVIEQPVEIIAINPLGGVAGSEVTFVAIVIGNPPFDFEWDFGGGAEPDEVSGVGGQPSAEVTLGVVGQYDASLHVENAEGSHARNFTLTVTETPGNPPEIVSVTPTEADSGTEVTFTAEVTGDPPLTYQWNFGGGASPNLSTEASPTVTLGRGGTLPDPTRTYASRLTVSNYSGIAVQDFELGITAWWHVEELPKYGNPDDYVSVQSVAFAPDGTFWAALELDETPDGPGGRSVRVASLEGDAWETHLTMDQPPADEPSLAIDSQGNPALSYAKGTFGGELWYADMSEGTWTHEYVAPGGVFKPYSTLVFDSQDRAIIAWTSREGDKPGTKLTVVRKSGVEWKTIFEESADNDNSGPSLAVDTDDRVHMSWRRIVFGPPTQREVWYTVEPAGGDWDTQIVTESQSVMWGTALALTSDGQGLILYIDWASDTGEYRVWVARQIGQEWPQDYLSSYPENLFHHGSLALGPDDLPVVTFRRYLQDDPIVAEGLWAWYHNGEWDINLLPIPDAYTSKAMFHPEGYPTLFVGGRLASYW